MPPSIDYEKMFVDLSPVKRCLCWLSPLVSRLHLAQPNQNTNTPLSFGCCPSHPPSLTLSLSFCLLLTSKRYKLGPTFLSPLFIFTCLFFFFSLSNGYLGVCAYAKERKITPCRYFLCLPSYHLSLRFVFSLSSFFYLICSSRWCVSVTEAWHTLTLLVCAQPGFGCQRGSVAM